MNAKHGGMRILLRRAVAAAVLVAAVNYVLRTVVRLAAHVPDAFDPFTWPPIVVASCAGVACGTVVYLVLRLFLKHRVNRVFPIVAYAVMVLSFATPIMLITIPAYGYPGTTWLTVATLEIMHATTAYATVTALTGQTTAPGIKRSRM
jgi:uncharacterized membrane protein